MVQLLGRPFRRIPRLCNWPKGGFSASWEKTLNKYIDRTNLIAYANLAPSLGADLYAMSYVAQIVNVAPKVVKAEKWALQRITHIPHNAFPEDTFSYQHEIGMRNINPIQLISKAAIIRTAIITCSSKTEWANLQRSRNEKGPMTNLAIPDNQPGKDNPWWNDPAFAYNLFEANKTIPSSTWDTTSKTPPKRKGPRKPAPPNGSKTPLLRKVSLKLSPPESTDSSLTLPKPAKEEPFSTTKSEGP